MRIVHAFKSGASLAAVAGLVACMSPGSEHYASISGGPGLVVQHKTADVCVRGAAGSGAMRCNSKVWVNDDGTVVQTATPQGYGPSDLRSAYDLPSSGGNGRVVAIVDSNDDPTAEADLGVYRAQYGLPVCTTANGCFQKVNQNGQASPLPATDTGWSGEISLDLDMVSAACPDCKILLVEANGADDSDLGTAVNTAASMGAAAISNSYGGGEDSTTATESGQYYDHPGVLVTASAGDQGYGAEFPATSQYVLAVGGTTLTTDGSARGWTETAWNDGGSGCSAYVPKPTWQHDTGCGMRTEADVAAVGDPNTGVAVYQTTGASGWAVYGGTSVASPLVAAIFTLLDLDAAGNAFPYANTGDFYDVTSGSNGTCDTAYLCNAGTGYDGPTGWGTPNGAALSGMGSGSSSGASGSGSGSSSGGMSSSSSGGGSGSSSGGALPESGTQDADYGSQDADSGTDSGSQDVDSGSQDADAGNDAATQDQSTQDGQDTQDSQDSQDSQDGWSRKHAEEQRRPAPKTFLGRLMTW